MERFWSKVNVGDYGECWGWIASKRDGGYGAVKVGGRTLGAHRVAYELCVGPVPEGQCVCHRCDNPGCVNPAHLFLGSQADNVGDMLRKGRYPRGDRHGNAKLTRAKVREIRDRYAKGGISHRGLAAEYGVSHVTVGRVINRKRYNV